MRASFTSSAGTSTRFPDFQRGLDFTTSTSISIQAESWASSDHALSFVVVFLLFLIVLTYGLRALRDGCVFATRTKWRSFSLAVSYKPSRDLFATSIRPVWFFDVDLWESP